MRQPPGRAVALRRRSGYQNETKPRIMLVAVAVREQTIGPDGKEFPHSERNQGLDCSQ
jgi:hypothetical protein